MDFLSIPKNRSTGSLPAESGEYKDAGGASRIRFSFDAGKSSELESLPRSPILAEHEHGLGTSGLRRIRQQPVSRVGTSPSSPENSFSLPSRSSSMTLHGSKTFGPGGPASPSFNFSEDLTRFPSESLHSFSFAHQNDELLQNRQNMLKRSVDFLCDRLGWAGNNPGLAAAQAKATGDTEVQKVMELLARANMLGDISEDYVGPMNHGPLTGPTFSERENVFVQSLATGAGSPEDGRSVSPTTVRVEDNQSRLPGPDSERMDPPTRTSLDAGVRNTDRPRSNLTSTVDIWCSVGLGSALLRT